MPPQHACHQGNPSIPLVLSIFTNSDLDPKTMKYELILGDLNLEPCTTQLV